MKGSSGQKGVDITLARCGTGRFKSADKVGRKGKPPQPVKRRTPVN